MGTDFLKLDFNEAPPSLFRYAKRFAFPQIDRIKTSDQKVRHFMGASGFCFDIYQAINDFYVDDWYFAGVLLFDDDYELAALIFSRRSPIQPCDYRIAVSAKAPHEVIEIASGNRGYLFAKRQLNKYEYQTIKTLYNYKIRYQDPSYRPTSHLALNRIEDEGGQILFEITHPRAFLSVEGPRSLFDYANHKFDRREVDFSSKDSRGRRRLPVERRDYLERLASLNQEKWNIESLFLTPDYDIEAGLLYHGDDQNLYLLVDADFRPIDVFDDLIIYREHRFSLIKDAIAPVRSKYAALEKPREATSSIITSIQPSALNGTIVLEEKEDDIFHEFRANFAGGMIIVIGPSHISEQDMNALAYDMFFPSGVIRYDASDYSKITGTSFDNLKRSKGKYLGIVLGPTPHKVRNLGKYPSLASKLKEEPGYPYVVEATTLTTGKTLKLTKRSLEAALSKIRRHHLQELEDKHQRQDASRL